MDPNATLQAILEGIADQRWQEARDLYENLQAWVARGGFPPSDPNWNKTILSAVPCWWRTSW